MNSKFRIRWDLWIITLVMYNALETPLELAFEQDFTSLGIVLFGYIVDLFFITDMAINFRTTFINEKTGLEEKKPRLIAKNYVTQWRFYTDTLSVIPFELFVGDFNGS